MISGITVSFFVRAQSFERNSTRRPRLFGRSVDNRNRTIFGKGRKEISPPETEWICAKGQLPPNLRQRGAEGVGNGERDQLP